MKLMWLDVRRFNAGTVKYGYNLNKKVFLEKCMLSLRFIKSMEHQYFHYWDNDSELCDNNFIGNIDNGAFPLIRSAKLKKLLNDRRLNLLIELGLIEKCYLDYDWVKSTQKCNTNAIYYYVITDTGNDLFDGTWTSIRVKDSEYIEKCLDAELPLLYRKIRSNFESFTYDLPEKMVIAPEIRKAIYRNNPEITDERCELLADAFYNQALTYSTMDKSLVRFTVSSDFEQWGGRIYNNFSHTTKFLRNFIILKNDPNETLVQLDFKTFQLHTLMYAMKKVFKIKDLGTFEDDLKNGIDIYMTLAMLYHRRIVSKQERNDMKGEIFRILFSEIKEKDSFWRILVSLYPEFADGLRRIKREPKVEFQKRMIIKKEDYDNNCYKQAPFLGSFYEVKFFVNIWRHLIKEGIEFVSIHDAVLVKESVKDDVMNYMMDTASEFFGYELLIEADLLGRDEEEYTEDVMYEAA